MKKLLLFIAAATTIVSLHSCSKEGNLTGEAKATQVFDNKKHKMVEGVLVGRVSDQQSSPVLTVEREFLQNEMKEFITNNQRLTQSSSPAESRKVQEEINSLTVSTVRIDPVGFRIDNKKYFYLVSVANIGKKKVTYATPLILDSSGEVRTHNSADSHSCSGSGCSECDFRRDPSTQQIKGCDCVRLATDAGYCNHSVVTEG